MSRPLRVAQILLSPRIGGAEALADSLEASWRENGIESKTIYLDAAGSVGRRWDRVVHLLAALRDYRPDVVLAHSNLPGIYARMVRVGAPVHVVLHSASDDHATRRARVVERILLLRTASVVAVGKGQLERYIAHFPQARTSIIPNGVSPNFSIDRKPSSRPRRIVTLARVAEQKRPEFWEKVTAEFARTNPDIEFEWWGPLSEREQLDQFVLQPRSKTATYMGPTDDSAEVLRGADIVFHPSSREAHSVTLLEAAVSGVPVVYADSLARPSADQVWSHRYAADSVLDAARALQEIVDRWPSAAIQAAEGAAAALSSFGIRKSAEAYVRLFQAD